MAASSARPVSAVQSRAGFEKFEKIEVRAAEGGVEAIGAVEDEWRRLADTGAGRLLFCRPEWTRAYLEAFAPKRHILLLTAHGGNGLLAVLPLAKEWARYRGVPVPMLRAPMNTHSFWHDIARARGPEGARAVAALWEYIEAMRGWFMVELPYVTEGTGGLLLAEAARKRGFEEYTGKICDSPYIPLSGEAAADGEWPCEVGRHLRHELRRWERGLNSAGSVEFDCVEDADPAALGQLFELEQSGWKGKAGTAMASGSDTLQFYRSMAAAAAESRYLALYRLRCGGRPIAALMALIYRGVCYAAKIAYDESFRQYAPGHLLISSVVRDCSARGCRELNFLGHSQLWKERWTKASRRVDAVRIIRRGPLGKAFCLARRLKRRFDGPGSRTLISVR